MAFISKRKTDTFKNVKNLQVGSFGYVALDSAESKYVGHVFGKRRHSSCRLSEDTFQTDIMSAMQTRPRPIPRLLIAAVKNDASKTAVGIVGQSGSLSPNLQPNTPPILLPRSVGSLITPPCKIGDYLLLDAIDSTPTFHTYKTVNLSNDKYCICKVITIERYQDILSPYYHISEYDHIVGMSDLIVGQALAYAIFPLPHSDLHSYVRSSGKLKECEASHFFQQIVSAVAHCHDLGVVLRDIKLRKCVFKDNLRTSIQICGLEDACILANPEDDHMTEKHGCPAYVSPEILQSADGYSGKAADIWSLGVVLYTMLVGRYPFQDAEPSVLFAKISLGRYVVPENISVRGRCLIRGLLRKDPRERLSTHDVLAHPWFQMSRSVSPDCCQALKQVDQNVPEMTDDCENDWISL